MRGFQREQWALGGGGFVARNLDALSPEVIPAGGHFAQDGRAVQTFAINLLMPQAVCRFTGIDEARDHANVVEHGNTGAAAAPSVLSQRWERWQDGDQNAVAVVGSGLSWSGLRVRGGASA